MIAKFRNHQYCKGLQWQRNDEISWRVTPATNQKDGRLSDVRKIKFNKLG